MLKYCLSVVAVCAALSTAPALALTADEAKRVVTALEQLNESFGSYQFDAEEFDVSVPEEADRIWEYDSTADEVLPKYGFNHDTWVRGVTETLLGYTAAIPADAIKAERAQVDKMIASSEWTPDQKAAFREEVDQKLEIFQALAAKGKPYAAYVAPYVARLRKMLETF